MAGMEMQQREWRGAAVLSYGFRPFFLLAAIWAALAMAIWIFLLSGRIDLPGNFGPFDWHAHEFVFGYTGAVIAGFILTAVPNWTGRPALKGWPLAGLVVLWLSGRIAVASPLDWRLVMAFDLSLVLSLLVLTLREIMIGQHWRNLPVVALMLLFGLANAGFHTAAALNGHAADGYGLRGGIAAVLMMIALIGGRIIPTFTRNWLTARGDARLPTAFDKADAGVLLLTALSLAGFVFSPLSGPTSVLCLLTGLAHLWRLSRWCGLETGAEPLLWVLHLAYAMLACGFLAEAAAGWDLLPAAAARHVWLAGGIGLITLAVMSRASLGHTGRVLHADRFLAASYLLLMLTIPTRLAAGIWPEAVWALHLSAMLWMLAFGCFALRFWTVLTRPPIPKKPV